ncbi:MAG: HEAT repeat domain-containing protein [Planctomycetota bacterium]
MSTLAGLVTAACDTASSDFASFTASFSPPTPKQAGQWAVDQYDVENQRRGTLLLANAPWGGTSVYTAMYRLYIEENSDPLVRAAALEAIGRHGEASDAELVAKQLKDNSVQVRMAAAKALQRLHDPKVTTVICSRLIDEGEESSVRVELAIALGQYPSDDVFQALAATLDARELSVNMAALDSLHLLTGRDFGLDRPLWLSWYRSTKTPFRKQQQYLYPTYQRPKGFWDRITFWVPLDFEKPGVPAGMQEPAGAPPKQPYGNVGEGKAPEAKGPS